MFQFVLKRILTVIPTFIAITLITFALVHLIPGDPVEIRMGERGVDPAVHAEMMRQMGLDRPLPEQYLTYMNNILHGDFGTSFRNSEPVLKEFFTLFPPRWNWPFSPCCGR